MQALLGTKLKQTQMFTEAGARIPVTYVVAGPCWITAITDVNKEKNVQMGFGNIKKLTKAIEGHVKKSGLDIKPRFFRSIRVTSLDEAEIVGKTILVDEVFAAGDKIRVTGISKGKGFAGVVKRHGFAGGPKTHGQSDRERAPGSIGATTTPGRVFKGQRMAGRMGTDTVTVRGLTVIGIDKEKNMLIIKGLVPGGANGLLVIQKDNR